MPGVNVLGGCRIWRNAEFEATQFQMQWSINGSLVLDTEFSDGSTSVSTTTGSVARTRTWTRIPFVYKDLIDLNFPGEDEFWLIQELCCCPCRLIIYLGPNNEAVGGQSTISDEVEFDSDTEVIDTPPPGGGSPTTTNFHHDGAAFVTALLKNGVIVTTAPPGRAPCRSAGEGNTLKVDFEVDYSGNLFVLTHLIPADLEENLSMAAGGTGTLIASNDVPGILSAQFSNTYCDGLSIGATSTWSGEKSVSGGSSDTTETFSVTLNISTVLS